MAPERTAHRPTEPGGGVSGTCGHPIRYGLRIRRPESRGSPAQAPHLTGLAAREDRGEGARPGTPARAGPFVANLTRGPSERG
jgi:hypothetical protein